MRAWRQGIGFRVDTTRGLSVNPVGLTNRRQVSVGWVAYD